jgi:hypothetical protein
MNKKKGGERTSSRGAEEGTNGQSDGEQGVPPFSLQGRPVAPVGGRSNGDPSPPAALDHITV